MFSSTQLKEIIAQVRPIIERQIDDALQIAAFRDVVSAEGGDWSALKALLKAQVQDERDESGDGKHVKKLLSKAAFATAYADMLGLANMNEDNFSAGDDYGAETGGILDTESRPDGVPVASEADGPSGGYARHQSEPLSVPSAAQEAGDDDIAGECSSGRTESSADGQPNSPETANETEPSGVRTSDPLRSDAAAREDAGPMAPTAPSAPAGAGKSVEPSGSAAPSFDMTDPDAPTPAQKHFILALRPFCQNLNACGAQGRNHCHSCKRAAEAAGKVAA